MREIIDRAVDKAFKKQRKRLQSYLPQECAMLGGAQEGAPARRAAASPGEQEGAMFEGEQKEAHSSKAAEIMNTILERGHWEIRIRPAAYPDTLKRLPKLEDALLKSRVQYRGLPYPHGPESRHGGLYPLNGCIESRVRWAEFAGVLRLYASGQFVHYMAMPEDMLDDVRHTLAEWDPSRAPRRPPRRTFMYPASALYYLTEIYAFASKIAREGVLGDDIVVEITLHGQEGRVLRSETTPFMFADTDVCNAPEIRLGPHRVAAEKLRTDHDDMAVRDAAALLEKYGVDDDDGIEETLRGWQADFYLRKS